MASRTGRDVAGVVRRIVDEVRDAEVTFLAASLAYYGFSSLIPLLVVAVVVAAFVGGDSLRTDVIALAEQYLVPTAQGLVSDALTNQTGQGGVGLIGFVVATWGALKIFRGLDRAFSKVYGTDGGSIVEQVTDGVVALVGIGVGVAAVTVAGTVVALAPIPFSGLIASLVLLATLFVAFFPLYYVFPDVDVTVREVLPGTAVAAVGWTLLGAGFGIYADYAASEGTAALYGVLGAVLLLVTYFYLAGLVLLSGAVVNAVLAGRTPDRTVAGGARTAGDGDDTRATAGADAAGSTDDSGVRARSGTGARTGAGAGTGAATDADDATVGDSGG